MSTEITSNITNAAAGATAATVSLKQSMSVSESLYRASFDQIITGNFTLIFSDVIGTCSFVLIAINVCLAIRKYFKE